MKLLTRESLLSLVPSIEGIRWLRVRCILCLIYRDFVLFCFDDCFDAPLL